MAVAAPKALVPHIVAEGERNHARYRSGLERPEAWDDGWFERDVEESAQDGGYGASSREQVSRRLFPRQPKNAVSRPTGTAQQRKADTADRHGYSTIPDENYRSGESQGEADHLPKAQAKESNQSAEHYDHDRPQVRDEVGLSRRNAVGCQDERGVAASEAYESVANYLLIDAKPPKGAALPGGNGRPFDWSLTREFRPSISCLLSGGLDPDTVERAIALSGARGVDVSSGVESAPGVKDPARIRAFVAAARRAFANETVGVG